MHEYRNAILHAADAAFEAGEITRQDRRRIRLFCLLTRFQKDFNESRSTVELEFLEYLKSPGAIIDWSKMSKEDWIELAKIVLQIIALIVVLV